MNKQDILNQIEWYLEETEGENASGTFDQGYKEGCYHCEALIEQLDEPQKVKARLAKHWDEDLGDCLWWDFPVDEPPYCGTPLDDDFPKYKTHFTELHIPDGVEEEPKWVVKSNRLYFTGITQLIARDPITYNFTTDENRAHVFDDKESAEKEASFFDGTVEKVEV